MAVLRDLASFRSHVLLPETLDGWTDGWDGRMDRGLAVIRCGQTDTGYGRRRRTRQSDHRPLAVTFLLFIEGELEVGIVGVACQLRLHISGMGKLRPGGHLQPLKLFNPAFQISEMLVIIITKSNNSSIILFFPRVIPIKS